MLKVHERLPCEELHTIRPHVVDADLRKRIVFWIKDRGGIVIYVDYPDDTRLRHCALFISPIQFPAKAGTTPPGDDCVWTNGKILRNEEDRPFMWAPRVLRIQKNGNEVIKIAVDVILIEPGMSPEQTADAAFEWREK